MYYPIKFVDTQLIYFIEKKNCDSVKAFLDAGADVTIICPISGLTPLFLAINKKDPDICELLIRRGAKIGVFSGLNVTPLGYLLSNCDNGYQNLDYVKIRLILLFLRYGNNVDYKEGGILTSREMLDFMGYQIENRYLVAKSKHQDIMDVEIEELILKDDIDSIIMVD